MKIICRTLILLLFLSACTSTPKEVKKKLLTRLGFPDKYLLAADSVTAFDSLQLQQFISQNKKAKAYGDEITEFYQRREYTYAWFNGDTLSGSVYTFYNLLRLFWENDSDSLAYNEQLDSLLMNTGSLPGQFPDSAQKIRMEFLLTTQFFEYAKYEYEGHIRKDLRNLDWFIPRGKKNYQMLLDSLVAGVPDLNETEPVNPQYQLLKSWLVHYNAISDIDTIRIVVTGKTYKAGDKSPLVVQVRKKLALRGDLPAADTSSAIVDTELKKGIMSYQRRMGMGMDGKLSPALIEHLNTSTRNVMRKLLINMERLRWIPDSLPAEYIFVNIPEYKLHVNNDSAELFNMNVVVGKEATQTTVFNGKISRIVFSPYWNVPASILQEEMLPLLQQNPEYLASKDMEVLVDEKVVDPHSVDWKKYSPEMKIRVRQKPGPQNSLGHIKFLFPNQYAIYLHDTPSRHLFDETGRSYSHGCVRVADPVLLATFLLKEDSTWTEERIDSAMYQEVETIVNLKNKMPVFIGYFTAWVDRKGKLNLRDDIYGHDAILEAALF